MGEEEIKKHRDQLERDYMRRHASQGITEAAYQESMSKQIGMLTGLAGAIGVTSKPQRPSYTSHPVTPMDAFDANEHDTEFLQHVAKFYINGSIPVYRRYIKSANQWEYRLFEDNADGNVLFISCEGQTVTDHLRFILEAIGNCCSGMKSMKRAR